MVSLCREIQAPVQYAIIDRVKATGGLTCHVRTFGSCIGIPKMALSNERDVVARPDESVMTRSPFCKSCASCTTRDTLLT